MLAQLEREDAAPAKKKKKRKKKKAAAAAKAEEAPPEAAAPAARPAAAEEAGADAARAGKAADPPEPPAERHPCGLCGAEDARKVCGACKTARYCSAACQRDHWRAHRRNCAAPVPPDAPPRHSYEMRLLCLLPQSAETLTVAERPQVY